MDCTMYCCIMKIPNAGATHGTISANHGLPSPVFDQDHEQRHEDHRERDRQ